MTTIFDTYETYSTFFAFLIASLIPKFADTKPIELSASIKDTN